MQMRQQESFILHEWRMKKFNCEWKEVNTRFNQSYLDTDRLIQQSKYRRKQYQKDKYDRPSTTIHKLGDSKLDFYTGKGIPMIIHKAKLCPRPLLHY